MRDAAGYAIGGRSRLPERAVIAGLYRLAADTVQIFRIPALHVVKISFPRPVAQGSLRDRDIHAGQHHVPLAVFPLPSTLA